MIYMSFYVRFFNRIVIDRSVEVSGRKYITGPNPFSILPHPNRCSTSATVHSGSFFLCPPPLPAPPSKKKQAKALIAPNQSGSFLGSPLYGFKPRERWAQVKNGFGVEDGMLMELLRNPMGFAVNE